MLTFFIPLLVLLYLLHQARDAAQYRIAWRLVKGIRVGHVIRAWITLFFIGVVAFALLHYNSLLRWGWWSAIGGTGNIILGATKSTGVSLGSLIIPCFIALLLLAHLGRAALSEEVTFRLGDHKRCLSERIKRSVVFGLAHLTMGIPIGAALALSVGGLSFSDAYVRHYKRTGSPEDSVIEATRVHLTMNLTILALVIVYLVGALLGYTAGK